MGPKPFYLFILSVIADSARLLGTLISSSCRLVLPYVPPILRALLLKLRSSTQLAVLQVVPNAAVPKGPAQPGTTPCNYQVLASRPRILCSRQPISSSNLPDSRLGRL